MNITELAISKHLELQEEISEQQREINMLYAALRKASKDAGRFHKDHEPSYPEYWIDLVKRTQGY